MTFLHDGFVQSHFVVDPLVHVVEGLPLVCFDFLKQFCASFLHWRSLVLRQLSMKFPVA